MRHWRYIADYGELETNRLQSAHGRFPARSRALNEHLDFLKTVTHRLPRCILRHHLRRHRGGIGGDAARGDAVIGGKDHGARVLDRRRMPALPRRQPAGQLLQTPECAGRFGELSLALGGGGTRFEIGAGLGEFAAQLGGLQRHVVTDVDPQAVASMAERFADRPEVEARVVDLAQGPVDLGAPVSTVVAISASLWRMTWW